MKLNQLLLLGGVNLILKSLFTFYIINIVSFFRGRRTAAWQASVFNVEKRSSSPEYQVATVPPFLLQDIYVSIQQYNMQKITQKKTYTQYKETTEIL
jgi:hypothetical protein